MENCTTKQTDNSSRKVKHYRPSGNALRIGILIVQLNQSEGIRVDRIFKMMSNRFELVEPGGVHFVVEFLDQKRCYFFLE